MNNISKKGMVRVNHRIRCKEVRLIAADGSQAGIVSIEDSLRMALDSGLDLVEVAPKAVPPVCKIIDYGKFKYEQEKMSKEAKKKQHIVINKEIRLRPNIEEHDYQVKLKKVIDFLKHGDKVHVKVFFRGRELGFIERGRQVLDRILKDTEEYGTVDKLPGKEGKMLVMILVSSGKGSKKDAKDKNK